MHISPTNGVRFGNTTPPASSTAKRIGKGLLYTLAAGAGSYGIGAGTVGISNAAGGHLGDYNWVSTLFPFANKTPVDATAVDAAAGGANNTADGATGDGSTPAPAIAPPGPKA